MGEIFSILNMFGSWRIRLFSKEQSYPDFDHGPRSWNKNAPQSSTPPPPPPPPLRIFICLVLNAHFNLVFKGINLDLWMNCWLTYLENLWHQVHQPDLSCPLESEGGNIIVIITVVFNVWPDGAEEPAENVHKEVQGKRRHQEAYSVNFYIYFIWIILLLIKRNY